MRGGLLGTAFLASASAYPRYNAPTMGKGSDFTRRGTELAVSFLVRAKINLQNLSQMSQIWLANKSRGTHPVNIVFLIIFYTVSTIVLLDIRSLSDRRFK